MKNSITVTTKDLHGNIIKHKINLDKVRRISDVTGQGYSCQIRFEDNDNLLILESYNDVMNLIGSIK